MAVFNVVVVVAYVVILAVAGPSVALISINKYERMEEKSRVGQGEVRVGLGDRFRVRG